ncbi:hypothetical protein WAI453_012663 [Rhynchosporium graminicola]|uniref:PHD-type domain-containing protein n=1 Tax=Rhynchosporium graminicola TaxID=2792576 RepID=A0A1E1KQJ2_9HELO|nr:uncharacterized protein RCO7_08342 [Rhynchosporium commune]
MNIEDMSAGSGFVGSIDTCMFSAASEPSTYGNANSSDMGWSLHQDVIPNEQGGQHHDQPQFQTWDGGPYIWNDKHDEFCYVCGSTMELFQCQTCSTSYHASCMSPTISPSEVPDFWFCPHCVDRELHIPQPVSTIEFDPAPVLTPSGSFSDATQTRNSSLAQSAPPRPENYECTSIVNFDALAPDSVPVKSSQSYPSTEILAPPAIPSIRGKESEQKLSIATTAKVNTRRARRSYSPPRKKSKYSSFSSDVDKALTVIYKELESSAKVGKAEAELRDKIRILEQEVKLKDGQITLGARELEISKRSGGDLAALRIENEELKLKVRKLDELVESKDTELRDWRDRLKLMIGD